MNFEDILSEAKSGNAIAKEELFLMYRPLIISCSMIDGCFSEDLYQELSRIFLHCIDKFQMDYDK